jgi:diadenosine tetraphosphate (Ap4A) HIT family hydrolase
LDRAFEDGLLRLLEEDGLGTFVLVLANASFEPALFARLQARLAERFEQLAAAYREALRNANAVADAEDDQIVFLKLLAVGFEHLAPAEQRRAGPWEVQFNPLRALRPPRAARLVPKGIRAELDPHGFHFNRRFLQRELFWSGDLAGREVALFYNKYPFVNRHGLLVPERTRHQPQFLTADDHAHAWRVLEALAPALPGVGLGYNAYGAFASVNHLHFQLFVRGPLPVEDPGWRHAGGAEPYPLPCEVYASHAEAWTRIAALHAAEQPYNLVYRPGRLYCLPRLRQGTYEQAAWTGGFAWYELAGGFTLFNREAYERLAAEDVARELARAGGCAQAVPG